MLFSSAYAVADFLGSDAPTIPEMARTHGLLNAMGSACAGFSDGSLTPKVGKNRVPASRAEKAQTYSPLMRGSCTLFRIQQIQREWL
jgi:hypothetical protein